MSVGIQEQPAPASDVDSGGRYSHLPLTARGEESLRRGLAAAEMHGTGRLPGMQIASVLSLTTMDFPDRLAAVLYCARPYAERAARRSGYSWQAVEYFLDRWMNTLNGIVFAGFEPLLQPGLPDAVGRCRELGLDVALRTQGGAPEALQRLLPELDWVTLELKAMPHLDRTSRRIIQMLVDHEVAFDCRVQVDGASGCLLEMSRELAELGVTRLNLQAQAVDGDTRVELDVGTQRSLRRLFPRLELRQLD